ncbi:DUF2798 domain-containing protein [Marinomonas sp. 15G1-11]|uniref:DUF2798 domain-containing protein n=1 Tax=Marinomonas phaeophyticola TaxID=3004091 RepID=A0ABT4JTD1_9GAMM|nr:DUF2798 domain-containing protein [Marinomonas sp. 15G1-11]MCZ2721573.1 DUF2798 domain-containing protein [Marinomonas sp. 15G1-11]
MSDTVIKMNAPKHPLYQKILILACLISFVIGSLTGIMTYMNVGFRESFWIDWFSSFAIAALVMAPIGLVFMSLIGKFLKWALPNGHKILHQIITGVCMALFMESILAASTTVNLIGFTSSAAFVSAWLPAFTAALPFGLFMALMMSLVLKPKLEKFMAS